LLKKKTNYLHATSFQLLLFAVVEQQVLSLHLGTKHAGKKYLDRKLMYQSSQIKKECFMINTQTQFVKQKGS
jgi:hypothetical protein